MLVLLPLVVGGFGAHKTQAHLPLKPSLPPLPPLTGSGVAVTNISPAITYSHPANTAGDPDAVLAAAISDPGAHAAPEYFHEWSVNHPREGLAYFQCPTGFDFRERTKSCVMITYSAATESCPYGAYRDKVTKHCVMTDSVAPDRTCPSGFSYFMRGCIRRTEIEPIYSCSPGYSKVGSSCYSLTQVPALIRCPDGFTLDPAIQSIVDVRKRNLQDEHICVKHFMYAPDWHCPGNSQGEVIMRTTKLAEGDELLLSNEYLRVKCRNAALDVVRSCPFGYQPLHIHQLIRELQSRYMPLVVSAGWLHEKIARLAEIPESEVCAQVSQVYGEITCPEGMQFSKSVAQIMEDGGGDRTEVILECVPSIRALNERSKREERRARKKQESGERRMLSEVVHSIPTIRTPAVLKFPEDQQEECGLKRLDELLWEPATSMPTCLSVRIAPFLKGCKDDGVLTCVTENDCHCIYNDVEADYKCKDEGHELSFKTIDGATVHKPSIEVSSSVPVCLKPVYTSFGLKCPFDLTEPKEEYCDALAVSDMTLGCPEGYTASSHEKVKKKEGGEGALPKNSKRQPTSVVESTASGICELLEYADYQVSCPQGYERQRAKNKGNACVAEKISKPVLNCPAGFLPLEESNVDNLDVHDGKSCVKVIEIAPTLINPSNTQQEEVLDNTHNAATGEVTACILTKTGALSCGTERKYHGQTNLEHQEKFGYKYQAKYDRKTNKKIDNGPFGTP